MYYLLCDKDCQKPEKYKVFEGSFQNGIRNGKGEQQFENGCIYRGDFAKDAFHGSGDFIFPEGTKITGFFDNNRFRKGTVALSIGINISCITETDYETFEDYFKEFRVGIAPDCFLMGFTSTRGLLESAQVYVRGEPVATYQGSNLVFKVPGDPKAYLIVSKLWFYVGEIFSQGGDNFSGPVFDGRGSQVWYTGIGYNQGMRANSQLHGTQLMLRHCAGLQFFRDMKYTNGKFQSSITIFNNGLIFATEDDYFKGTLRIFLSNGDDAEFECALNEYSSLKLGVLKNRDDDSEIKISEKNGRILFSVKGKEFTLDEFKVMLG
jgi:hypothetical protein